MIVRRVLTFFFILSALPHNLDIAVKIEKIKLDTISILINDKLTRSLSKSLNPVNVLFKDIHRVYLHKTKLHYFLPYRFLK